MNIYCPVCFNPTTEPVCPHCETNIQHEKTLRNLEQLSGQNLPDVLRTYLEQGHQAAAGRLLGRLAHQALRVGDWHAARSYLEVSLALGEAGGGASFRAEMLRLLGGLLCRMGEMPLGSHMLDQAHAAGDPLARLEQLQVAVNMGAKSDAMHRLKQLEAESPLSARAAAWRLETIARLGNFPTDTELKSGLESATRSGDPLAEAVARRALGLWQTLHGEGEAGRENLQAAMLRLVQQGAPYESARTQVDMARALLLTAVESAPPGQEENTIQQARRWLSHAIVTFRRLGTPHADQIARDLASSLAIGRLPSLPGGNATSTSVSILWVALEGPWNETTTQAVQTAARAGGALCEPMLGGVSVLFTQAQNQGDAALVIETAFAIRDVLHHHHALAHLGPDSTYRITAGTGILPHKDGDTLILLRALPHSNLFQALRAQAGVQPDDTLYCNDMLYQNTQAAYHYTEDDPDDAAWDTAEWWAVQVPPFSPAPVTAIRRHQLPDYGGALLALDPVLTGFKLGAGRGGGIAIMGAPGTGKTRLLEVLRAELQRTTKPWIIHLRGRNAASDEPFGAIRHWLGAEVISNSQAPAERRLSHIATFRRSLIGLLMSKPLLLLVDDIHLLDSASLATLRAVLPLTISHPLLVIVTARPDTTPQAWRGLWTMLQNALPEQTILQTLPAQYAYQPKPWPEEVRQRHVLACAAVLGDTFSTVVLRNMSNERYLMRHLAALHAAGWLVPQDPGTAWAFPHTTARDALLADLPEGYRKTLHWYARQALKKAGLPDEAHVVPAGLPEPALKVSLRRAAAALEVNAPREALLHFEHALAHYDSEVAPVELWLARADSLLSLGEWTQAAAALDEITRVPDLAARDEVSAMLMQGELHYRVGEVASLFRLYEQAAAKLRTLPTTETDISEQVSLLYAQSLARYKRGELEIARSLTGGALLMAQQHDLADDLGHLWQLLADIHMARGEFGQAQRAIVHAIASYRRGQQQWGLMAPLARFGELLLKAGDLDTAAVKLRDALDLAEAAGDEPIMIQTHTLLGTLAAYKGQFGVQSSHLAAALDVASFADDPGVIIRARLHYVLGLVQEKRGFLALQQATLARQSADRTGQAPSEAYLALAVAALALQCPDDADYALAQAEKHAPTLEESAWRTLLQQLQMRLAIQRDDVAACESILTEPFVAPRDSFAQAHRHLLVGEFRAHHAQWNIAAREYEQAMRIFKLLGADYWLRMARGNLDAIAGHAPGYRNTARVNLRGE